MSFKAHYLLSKNIRLSILDQCHKKQSGHLGGCLSCVELMIFGNEIISKNNFKNFILSKGHAGLAFYSYLYRKKKMTKKLFDSFLTDKSYLGEHPSPKLSKLINFSTGSLGHGLSFGAGLAYSIKKNKKKDNVCVLMSDGECNAGTVWEAAMLSAKLNLDNLYVLIDYNKWQATGRSNEVLSLEPLKDKWNAFGWESVEVFDGHNLETLVKTYKILKKKKPKIIIAHTIKGKGIKKIEDDNNWHYRSPNNYEIMNFKKEIQNEK